MRKKCFKGQEKQTRGFQCPLWHHKLPLSTFWKMEEAQEVKDGRGVCWYYRCYLFHWIRFASLVTVLKTNPSPNQSEWQHLYQWRQFNPYYTRLCTSSPFDLFTDCIWLHEVRRACSPWEQEGEEVSHLSYRPVCAAAGRRYVEKMSRQSSGQSVIWQVTCRWRRWRPWGETAEESQTGKDKQPGPGEDSSSSSSTLTLVLVEGVQRLELSVAGSIPNVFCDI